ncbi:MAG: HAMP domain-containing protein [Pseudomonadota bacterium]
MQHNTRVFGLKEKFLLMVLFPVVVTFVVIAVYSRMSMNAFGEKIGLESTTIVTQMAEAAILEKARSVAKQVELALQMNPTLAPEEFNNDPVISKLATQKVGLTGYTVMFSVPDKNTQRSLTLVHPAKDLIGKDTPSIVKKRLGERYLDWFKIYSSPATGKEGTGYYPWKDDQGKERNKFMASVPIANTPYAISATTYLDEFLTPVKKVESEISDHIAGIGRVHMGTMFVGLIVFAACVIFGISRISKKIVALTHAIGEVSMGRVDNEIEIIKSNDELQDLSEAFERMRTGVKFIMQKLEKSQKK